MGAGIGKGGRAGVTRTPAGEVPTTATPQTQRVSCFGQHCAAFPREASRRDVQPKEGGAREGTHTQATYCQRGCSAVPLQQRVPCLPWTPSESRWLANEWGARRSWARWFLCLDRTGMSARQRRCSVAMRHCTGPTRSRGQQRGQWPGRGPTPRPRPAQATLRGRTTTAPWGLNSQSQLDFKSSSTRRTYVD